MFKYTCSEILSILKRPTLQIQMQMQMPDYTIACFVHFGLNFLNTNLSTTVNASSPPMEYNRWYLY